MHHFFLLIDLQLVVRVVFILCGELLTLNTRIVVLQTVTKAAISALDLVFDRNLAFLHFVLSYSSVEWFAHFNNRIESQHLLSWIKLRFSWTPCKSTNYVNWKSLSLIPTPRFGTLKTSSSSSNQISHKTILRNGNMVSVSPSHSPTVSHNPCRLSLVK